MKDLTQSFGTLYHPQKALVLFEAGIGHNRQYYIEAYDMNEQGQACNAHPLSVTEANALVKALQTAEKEKSGLLALSGLMPSNVLYLKTDRNPFAVWYTPARTMRLFFKEDLGIPSGECAMPALIWKAGKKEMAIYACADATELTPDTPLLHAPFFNVYSDGRVCMGNTQVDISKDCPLEKFMEIWQDAFYNSYFSHLLKGHLPVNGNIVQLWKSLSGTGRPFPNEVLIPHKAALKHLFK
ncbi:PRTRC system protein B [Mucilaginibacter terrae]|uniref:PRTRC genetic system protein B n=1 Tax=Mucilaginibacter terrae TaxID=1955052 RepID=A0ABU3GN73_9SPHI|nr:PRTRC system protein B [Mucilaginibacter terrae]MDT3401235.1 PRTRC genetic system protein B [Mucilaginibacter terrae]